MCCQSAGSARQNHDQGGPTTASVIVSDDRGGQAMARDDEPNEGGRQISAGVVGLALVAVLLAVFIFQNTVRVPVKLLLWEFEGQMWMVLLGTAVVSLVLVELASMLRRRRRR
jgi:uncharacterized integral membrane protein